MSGISPATLPALPGSSPAVGRRVLPWDGLLMCTSALLLISVARLHSLVPGLHLVRPALLLAGLGVALYLSNAGGVRSTRHLRNPLGYLVLFFLAWSAAGAPFGIYVTHSVSFLLKDFFSTAVIMVLVAVAVRSIDDVRRLVMTLAIGGMVFSLFAALPAGYRAVGAGGYDPNDSAMFVALTMPLTAYLLIRERRMTYKIVLALALVVCTIAIVRTGSRGGFLTMAAVVGYIVFFFQGVKPAFRALTVAAVAVVTLLTASSEFWERMETIGDPTDYNYTEYSGRKALWGRAREYMVQNPVFGVGINNFPVAEGRHPLALQALAEGRGVKWSAPHSIWYQAGAETGFPGLAAYVGIFVLAAVYLRRVVRLARRHPRSPVFQDVAGISAALLGSLLAIAVAGTFLSLAYSSMVWSVFGLVLGWLKVLRLAGVEVTRNGPGSAPPAVLTSSSADAPRSVVPIRRRYRASVYRPIETRFDAS